jgi:DNA modification methylase
MIRNRLYYGDNLTIMRQEMGKSSVDLIYLDPPFNSRKDYNLLYKNMTGMPVPEQVEAFCDTWELDADKERLARTMPVLMKEYGVDDYYVQFWRLWMQALRTSQPHLLAYLIYMVERLLHMKVLLRPTGSLYLHCDPTVSHYIKIMMDGIFGHHNFRSEVIWKRTSGHYSAKRWGPAHDVILFYTKSDKYKWNRVSQPYDKAYIDNFYRFEDKRGRFRLGDLTGAGVRTGASGQPWKGIDPTDSGRHWAVPAMPGKSARELKQMSAQDKLDALEAFGLIYWPSKEGGIPQFRRYFDSSRGVAAQDVIVDIDPLSPHSTERLGYPTQKPVTLLDRIIKASSDSGDVVFDPFCGCGTTIYSAVQNKRHWIGCDIAILSIRLIQRRLAERYHLVEGTHYEVSGIPVSVESAQALFQHDPFQFQHWAVEQVGGFPMQKKSADRGIDGRIYFETHDGLQNMVLSVKGGAMRPSDIRDLRGVLEREENSVLAGFISLREPTKAMRLEAASAGVYEYGGFRYDRIQLLTIKEILEEKRQFNTPTKIGIRRETGQADLPLRG